MTNCFIMKFNCFLCIVFLALSSIPSISFSQNFTGQWKGEFIDKSSSFGSFSGDKCEYVLELESKGNKVFGSSYTYFTENGKRYYTICKVEGYINEKQKYLEIKETQRTKTNIPSNIHNCFQIHTLTYFKKGNIETVEGNWTPAPNQNGNCGYGTTKLSRRLLVNDYPNAYASTINNKKTNSKSLTKNNKDVVKQNNTQNIIAQKENKKITASTSKSIKDTATLTTSNTQKTSGVSTQASNTKDIENSRKKNLISVIKANSNSIEVNLYDNGDIDGDIISLFFNHKCILSKQKLSEKPITVFLDISDEKAENELVMYAENLGTIPPNTAMMIVTDGSRKYEARITSDLEKSGTVKFIHNK